MDLDSAGHGVRARRGCHMEALPALREVIEASTVLAQLVLDQPWIINQSGIREMSPLDPGTVCDLINIAVLPNGRMLVDKTVGTTYGQ